MKRQRQEDKTGITQDLSLEISGKALERFKSFCRNILGTQVDEVPSEQSIFMKQSLSIVYYATILFLLTNGFYLVKNIVMNTMIVIDMIPLYMMVAASLTMLRSSYYAVGYAANDIVLIVLWIMATMKDPSYFSVTIIFTIFFFFDLYGFVSWRKREAVM